MVQRNLVALCAVWPLLGLGEDGDFPACFWLSTQMSTASWALLSIAATCGVWDRVGTHQCPVTMFGFY